MRGYIVDQSASLYRSSHYRQLNMPLSKIISFNRIGRLAQIFLLLIQNTCVKYHSYLLRDLHEEFMKRNCSRILLYEILYQISQQILCGQLVCLSIAQSQVFFMAQRLTIRSSTRCENQILATQYRGLGISLTDRFSIFLCYS